MVTVTEVDEKRNRIALTMKTEEKSAAPRKRNENRREDRSSAPETDMAAKLAALAGKFI
jgi:uncharacterized protein